MPSFAPASISDHPEDLMERVLVFGRALRQAGTGTTPAQTLNAAHGLKLIDFSSKKDFKTVLRACLVSNPESLALFDYLFDLYFTPGLDRTPPAPPGEPPLGKKNRFDADSREAAGPRDHDGQPRALAVGPSSLEVSAHRDFARLDPEEADEIRRQVRRLARGLAARLKRRWALSGRSRKLDFRKTFRASIERGGELIELVTRPPRHQRPRFVVLADISGSMDVYTRFFLTFMKGLTEVLSTVDTYLFSTRLVRATHLMKQCRPEELLPKLGRMGLPFSGGTRIGDSLVQFLTRYRSALVGRRTTAVIISDGWDCGETEVLDRALTRIRALTQGLIWLNPLAHDNEYQPLARGMATALPHLTAFSSFACLADVDRLGRLLEAHP